MSDERTPFRLRDHVGVLSGLLLGLIAFLFLVYLAVRGFEPAVTLLVVLVVGIALVAVGTRLRS